MTKIQYTNKIIFLIVKLKKILMMDKIFIFDDIDKESKRIIDES